MPTPPRVLWVATKSPWPPVDGGRLLLSTTLGALREAGIEVTLVAPHLGPQRGGAASLEECAARLREICRPVLVASRLRPAAVDLARSTWSGRPWTLLRHRNAGVLRRVAEELDHNAYDIVVAEQVQALSQVPERPARSPGPPLVLRAQNVESDLWRALAAADSHPAPLRWWLSRQAHRLARAEGRAVQRCAATVALTEHDALVLGELAAGQSLDPSSVGVIPATARMNLTPGPALEGEPAVVLFGSAGWRPNAEGARTFVERDWPRIRSRSPGAVLHLFGDLLGPDACHSSSEYGLRVHPAPEDSATALAEGSVLVVPLAVASGVRMKILEAWARGVVVVASPTAAQGLVATDGIELLVAEDRSWATVVEMAKIRYDELTSAARERLLATYAPSVVAQSWLELLGRLAAGR